MIGMGAVVAMVATILSVVVYRRSLAMFLDSRRGVVRSPTAEAIQRLKDVEAGPSVGEQLRDLASRQPGP
ncbi:MAG: hypothetical protein GTO03_12490, partial [Planctomycetales bacterium]|nr:hypothetical protein [Planctomycetales bacterium]